MDITPYLRLMADQKASDLFFYTGAAVHIKIDGVIRPLGNETLKPGMIDRILQEAMTDAQFIQFKEQLELDFVISLSGVGRFRANAFNQRGESALVLRYVQHDIPTIEQLNLPLLLNELIMAKRGLILVVGATGSGKSTSLASMIDYRNRRSPGHILTIEDPVEFIHAHQKSVVGQREIGIDTHSYGDALKSAMREAPDVILIGEVRDQHTMRYAIHYAESGHLCLSTLHSNNAQAALQRVVNFFSEAARDQFLMDLALNLRAIISQRLLPGVDGKLVPAVEVMLNTPYISDLIHQGRLGNIREAMQQVRETGMQSFDQSLVELYVTGKITRETAVQYADSANDVALQIRQREG